MKPKVRQLLSAWLLAVLLAVLLAGCVRLDGEATITDDDTISGTVIVAVHEDWSIGNNTDPLALQRIFIEELEANPGGGISAEPYSDGEWIGAEVTLTDVDIDRIDGATNGTLTVTAVDGGYQVAGRFEDLDTTAPSGPDGQEMPTPWRVNLAITFPERVTEHNGTLVGRTVTWDAEPGDDRLFATTAGSGFSFPAPVPVLLLGLLLVGAGAVIVFHRRRRRD